MKFSVWVWRWRSRAMSDQTSGSVDWSAARSESVGRTAMVMGHSVLRRIDDDEQTQESRVAQTSRQSQENRRENADGPGGAPWLILDARRLMSLYARRE